MIEIEDTLQNGVPNVTFKNVSFSWPGKNEHVICISRLFYSESHKDFG